MLPAVAGIALLLVTGALLWPRPAAASPVVEAPPPPPPEAPPPPAPPPKPVAAPPAPVDFSAFGGGAAVAAAGALGTIAGGAIAEFTDPGGKSAPITHAALPVVGGVVASALVLAAGPQAIIVLPIIVITALVNDIARAIESTVRFNATYDLGKKIQEARNRHAYFEAWAYVETGRRQGFVGLEWISLHDVPDTLPLKEPMRDVTGAMVSSINVRDQIRWAYSLAPDVAGGAALSLEAAQARGDRWADALGDLPWMSQNGKPGSLRTWATYEGIRKLTQAQIAEREAWEREHKADLDEVLPEWRRQDEDPKEAAPPPPPEPTPRPNPPPPAMVAALVAALPQPVQPTTAIMFQPPKPAPPAVYVPVATSKPKFNSPAAERKVNWKDR